MNHKIIPVVMGLLTICSVWLVTDLAYNVRFWHITPLALLQRLGAMLLIILASFVHYRFFIRVADRSVRRVGRKGGRKEKIREYAWITTEIVVNGNIVYLLITYFVNLKPFDRAEAVLVNAIVLPIAILFYLFVRNNRLQAYLGEQSVQLEKVRSDQLQTELKFLKSQYHPHFLFNALNTVYFQIDEKNPAPRRTLEMLSDLLRYQLYSDNGRVPIRQELAYLKTYMDLQRLRASKRLKLEVEIHPQLDSQRIYPLLFLPLMENAFKYVQGDYRIRLSICPEPGRVVMRLSNSLPPEAGKLPPKEGGIGLENLRRRLDLLYPDGRHSLRIRQEKEEFKVELSLATEER